MYLTFYIPFVYAFRTRMGFSLAGAAKWVCEYLTPTFLCFVMAGDHKGLLVDDYLLMTVIIYTIYEIGYILNDTLTVKNETNPTRRLSEKELDFWYKHMFSILAGRIILALILSLLLLVRHGFSKGSVLAISFSWMILGIYFIYNQVRGHLSFILHFLLLVLRYTAALFILLPDQIMPSVCTAVLIFPLPVMMEIIASGKFGIHYSLTKIYLKNYQKRYKFRIYYYTLLSTVYFLLVLDGFVYYKLFAIPFIFMVYEYLFYFLFKRPAENKIP
jgi:hypothetical protein